MCHAPIFLFISLRSRLALFLFNVEFMTNGIIIRPLCLYLVINENKRIVNFCRSYVHCKKVCEITYYKYV